MREYVRPMALVEEFVANSYVAKCTNDIAVGNAMRCINPEHSHAYNYYFANVWVEAANDACDIIVTSDSLKSDIGADYRPAKNAWVYAISGAYQCTERREILGVQSGRWVPSFVNNESGGGECYGGYEHDGSYTEAVMS